MYACVKRLTLSVFVLMVAASLASSAADLHPANSTMKRNTKIAHKLMDDSVSFLVAERKWYKEVEHEIAQIPIRNGAILQEFFEQCVAIADSLEQAYFQNAKYLTWGTYSLVLENVRAEITKQKNALKKKWPYDDRFFAFSMLAPYRTAILKIYNTYAPQREYETLKTLDPAVGARWKDYRSYWHEK